MTGEEDAAGCDERHGMERREEKAGGNLGDGSTPSTSGRYGTRLSITMTVLCSDAPQDDQKVLCTSGTRKKRGWNKKRRIGQQIF